MNSKTAACTVCVLLLLALATNCHAAQNGPENQDPSGKTVDSATVTIHVPETAQHYIKKLEAISAVTGHAPTLSAFRQLLLHANPRLSSEDYGFVWAAFIDAQHPQITLEDLRRRRSLLRDSIATFRATWTIEYTWNKRVDQSAMNFRTEKFDFWMDADKLRYDAMRGPSFDNMRGTAARSFDGNVERVFDDDQYGKRGVVHPLISVSYYFDRSHPLWVAKLIDSQRDLGKARSELENFQDRYAYPLEEIVEFNGAQCIQLAEQDTVYYLDPNKNYAYRGLETGRFRFNAQAGRLIESDSYSLHVLNEMRECADGIWLPLHATETRYVAGNVETVLSIKTTCAEVNKPIAPSVFEDMFPKGTDVVDGVLGVTYTQGESRNPGTPRSAVDDPNRFGLRRPSADSSCLPR